MKKRPSISTASVLGTTLISTITPAVAEAENPFGYQPLEGGYLQLANAESATEKAMKGKCAANASKSMSGKCASNNTAEGKTISGKCASNKATTPRKEMSGKCGARKCASIRSK